MRTGIFGELKSTFVPSQQAKIPSEHPLGVGWLDDKGPDHIAFGSGIHTRLGAQLARIETKVALSELPDRVESIQVRLDKADPARTPAFVLGFDSLPISFETTV